MKKLLLLTLVFFIHVVANGQAQRLAVLPYTMKLIDGTGASYLPTLCVDYFNDVPKAKDSYSVMGESANLAGMDVSPVDSRFDKVKIKDQNGNRTTPHLKETAYLSPEGNSEALSAPYTDFIDARIEHYKIGGFSKSKQQLLQNDVWAYDILNKLGYVDENISDATTRFYKAKSAFKADFLPSNSTAKNEEIIDFATILKLNLHDNTTGVQTQFIIKGSSNQYIVFNDIAPPIYKGSDEAEVVHTINSNALNEKIIIKTLGFENSTKAKAFQFEIKGRFEEKFSKIYLL